jgi:RNA polymerase sigma-70 factor (ECF subfamily)
METTQESSLMTAITDDGEVVLRLQGGDLEALGELYDRHKTSAYRTALAITHDPIAADDILQDCFLKLYRYADTIDPTRPIKPWLNRVTVNLAYSWAKRKKRWQTPLDCVQQKLVNPPHTSPERQVEWADTQNEVIQAITCLEIHHRIVIVLYYLNSLNIDEIATILNCPVGTVKSRLHYGREKLRAQLSANGTTTLREMNCGQRACTIA